MTAHAADGYHTPGLADVLDRMGAERKNRFTDMLDGWKVDVRTICSVIKREPSVLEKVRETLRHTDWDDTRPLLEIEESLVREKAEFWTAKQIGRELKRSPDCVYRIAQRLRVSFSRRKKVGV